MTEGRELADAWASLLKRNNLVCLSSCCTEARLMADHTNVMTFEAMTDDERAQVRATIDAYEAHEKAGGRFHWTGPNGGPPLAMLPLAQNATESHATTEQASAGGSEITEPLNGSVGSDA